MSVFTTIRSDMRLTANERGSGRKLAMDATAFLDPGPWNLSIEQLSELEELFHIAFAEKSRSEISIEWLAMVSGFDSGDPLLETRQDANA